MSSEERIDVEAVTTCSRAVEMRGLPLGSPRIRRRREAGAETSTHRRHGRKMRRQIRAAECDQGLEGKEPGQCYCV